MQVAKRNRIEIEVIPEDEKGEIDFRALEEMLTSGRKPVLVAINHVPTNSGLHFALPFLPSFMAGPFPRAQLHSMQWSRNCMFSQAIPSFMCDTDFLKFPSRYPLYCPELKIYCAGRVYNAAAVGQLAKRHGVPYLLDACQSAGQIPLDVTQLGCWWLTATSRKYLRGPRGMGFVYASE